MSRIKYSLGILMAVLLMIAGVVYVYAAHYVQFKPKQEIELTAWYANDDRMWKNFAGLVKDYNTDEGENCGITVKVKAFESKSELYDEIIKAIENGEELPDITACDTDFAAYLDQKAVLADVEKYFDNWDSAVFNSQMLEAAKCNDRLVALPVATQTDVFILNTELFSDISAISNFEKICTVSDEYYARNNKSFFSISDYSLFFRTASAQLGDSFDAESPHNTDNENSKYIYSLIAQAAFNRGYCTNYGDAAKMVADGELVCAIVPSSEIMNYAYDMDSSVISFPDYPCLKDGKNIYVEEVSALTLFASDSEREKAAASFLKWFTSTDINSDFVADSGYIAASGVAAAQSEYEIYDKLSEAIALRRNDAEYRVFSASAEYSENSLDFEQIMAAIMSSLN